MILTVPTGLMVSVPSALLVLSLLKMESANWLIYFVRHMMKEMVHAKLVIQHLG